MKKRTILFVALLLGAMRLLESCKDDNGPQCVSVYHPLKKSDTTIIQCYSRYDTLTFQRLKNGFTDTVIFVKNRVIRDWLQFQNGECSSLRYGIYFDAFYTTYVGNFNDSMMWSIVQPDQSSSDLFFQYQRLVLHTNQRVDIQEIVAIPTGSFKKGLLFEDDIHGDAISRPYYYHSWSDLNSTTPKNKTQIIFNLEHGLIQFQNADSALVFNRIIQ